MQRYTIWEQSMLGIKEDVSDCQSPLMNTRFLHHQSLTQLSSAVILHLLKFSLLNNYAHLYKSKLLKIIFNFSLPPNTFFTLTKQSQSMARLSSDQSYILLGHFCWLEGQHKSQQSKFWSFAECVQAYILRDQALSPSFT